MLANDVLPGQATTSNCTTGGACPLDGRWMWAISYSFAFIGNRALRPRLFLFFFNFLHAFTKANDTPKDNDDTPGEEHADAFCRCNYAFFLSFFSAFWGGEDIRDGIKCILYILRKYAHVNIEMKALTLLSTSFIHMTY